MESNETFYLRMAGGKVFGPVDMSTLRQWAADGRVEPSATVSRDRKEWARATDIPELEMEWVVENEPGQFYGPTHRTVVDDLIKSGSLAITARFYRDMRGGLAERADAEAAAADAAERIAELEQSLSAARDELLGAERELTSTRDELVGARRELAAVQDELLGVQRELSEAQSKLSASQNELSAALAHGREEATITQTQLKELEAEKVRLDGETSRLEGKVEEYQQELAKGKEAQDAANKDLAECRRELAAVKEELEAIKHQREVENEKVLVPEVVVEGMPPKAASAFARPSADGTSAAGNVRPNFGSGASPFGGASPSSLADLERAAQAELARMRASGAKGFFFGRRK